MKTMRFVVQSVVLLWLLGMFACGAHAGILTTLHIFNFNDGQYPQATLTPGANGSFYGSTASGGATGHGTIFRVTTNGVFFPLASFGGTNGMRPLGRLLASGDVFFGTTQNGGPFDHGTVFQFTSSNTIAMQVVFTNFATDGQSPAGGLISDTSGILHGTTLTSGPNGYGTVFKMSKTDTAPTTLASFSFGGLTGASPESGLFLRDNGWFYGTTLIGGTNNAGAVFKMSSSGVVSNLFSFGSTNGTFPWAGLVKGADDALYGTTASGGPGNYGTIFKVTTNDIVEMVAALDYTNGASPYAELTAAADGSLYGVAQSGGANGKGTIFKVTTNSALLSLHSFNTGSGSGPGPLGGMVFGPDGHLYGTTVDGGNGSGIVFRFILNPPAPVMQSVTATNGDAVLTWSAVAGGDYQLQFKTNLMQANWSNLGFAITATNSTIVAIDTAPPDAQRFYRAVLLQP